MEELTIRVPSWIKKEEAEVEFIKSLKTKTQLKMELFRSRMIPLEKKYGCSFEQFRENLNSENEENFEKWDDLMEWEANFNAFNEWKIRFEELTA